MFGVHGLRRAALVVAVGSLSALALYAADDAAGRAGYYREPALHGNTLLFTSEGDLWTVSLEGGAARRLTSAAGREDRATIAPDGKTVAFYAQFEGPGEVYTMPIGGGIPQRQTWDSGAEPVGWNPDGRLLIETTRYATLPDPSLVLIGSHGEREMLPLATGSEAVYASDGKALFFTRMDKQWSNTKRYKGGFIQHIWRYDGQGEAVPLTDDYAGTSHAPMFWNGHVYFLSDRDGVMNVWSMDPDGHGLKQLSHQKIFDVQSASVSDGRIVYACAGGLWSLDLTAGRESVIPITLVSDFDQLQEHWVTKPMGYLTDAHLSPDGERVVFTARGEIFTLPAKTGRIIRVAGGDSSVRYRAARFMPDGKSVVALSTQSGETEFWKFPANGEGAPEQWTSDAKVLRWDGIPSPDGHYLAHYDKDQQLWVYDTKTKQNKRIAQSMNGGFGDLSWSPDSQWLAYVEGAENNFAEIRILNVESGKIETLTSDRYNSESPAWSSDGKWLYFLSDRALNTTVPSPWGTRQPDPHFNHPEKIYQVALVTGLRSPFLPADELHPDTASKDDKEEPKKDDTPKDKADNKDAQTKPGDTKATDEKKPEEKKSNEKKPPEVKIDFANIDERLTEVPVPSGNYEDLQATAKRLCWLSASDEIRPRAALECLSIDNKGDEPDTVMAGVRSFEISLDRKKMLLRKGEDFLVVDSDAKGSALGDAKALAKAKVDLSHWQLSTTPREEFRGLFLDAWRLERDYFYDRHMQGVDWIAMRERYLPLVDRVSDRDELNDVIAQMVSELSALHTFVRGGDERKPEDDIGVATLGARLRRDEKAGGFVVDHIYQHDPDLPNTAPPLAHPDSLVAEGEVIVGIDGTDALTVRDERELLRGKAGTQVMLRVKSAKGDTRDVLVKPINEEEDEGLRYSEWEYSRRLKVEEASHGAIGYVHLRAMGPNDIDQWERDYTPIYDRQGLIIDVRHNQGGNIDSWLLGKLLRQAWFYFQPRVGNPTWNMQEAFRGHIIVLCDQETASDGEAFTEGFKRFKMGTVIGMRTWGGEIWLSANNRQADGGVATAAETGVYGPEGKWLIEGHGVDPDIVVDNLPHATFEGHDAELQAAIDLLTKQIQEDPRPVPPHPPYPDKSFPYQH